MVLNTKINCPSCGEQFLTMTVSHMKGFCPSCNHQIYKAPKSNSERQKESDDRHRSLGRTQSKWWLTSEEKTELKAKLSELRKSDSV